MDHFTREGDTKKCKQGRQVFLFVSSCTHLSLAYCLSVTLLRQLQNKHPDSLPSDIVSPKPPILDEYFVRGTSELPSLPPLDRQAIAAYASNPVIPFDLVEFPVFQWAYGVKCRDIKKSLIV